MKRSIWVVGFKAKPKHPLAFPNVLLHVARHTLHENAPVAAPRPAVSQLRRPTPKGQSCAGGFLQAGPKRGVPAPLGRCPERVPVVRLACLVQEVLGSEEVPLPRQRQGVAIEPRNIASLCQLPEPWAGALRHGLRGVFEVDDQLKAGSLLHVDAVVKIVMKKAHASALQLYKSPIQRSSRALNEEPPCVGGRVLQSHAHHSPCANLPVKRQETPLLWHKAPQEGRRQRRRTQLLADKRKQHGLDQGPQRWHLVEVASSGHLHREGRPAVHIRLPAPATADLFAQHLRTGGQELRGFVVREEARVNKELRLAGRIGPRHRAATLQHKPTASRNAAGSF
mmetsp:Transcript_47534/g.113076  ORF Transcript_47534/g.113076 Transcript_47534/m.113076 type:complete len:338 (-) Transcript_47534:98-1111(-)